MLTAQQQAAVERRDVSIVLSSGAGCGKTHVLTRRYLSHLEKDEAEVGQIVAITFTERAARQMRERIRRAVVQHVRTAPTDAEAERWARHLGALETAPISTIHSFCGTLLRQHAVEAGLDPRFDVLEDVLAVNLESESLTACLQRLLTAQSTAGDDLRQLVLLYGWRPVVETVQHLVRGWDERACLAWIEQTPEDVARFWRERAQSILLPRYIDYLLGASPRIARCLALLRRKPPIPGSQMAENVARLLGGLPRLAEAEDLSAAVEGLIEASKVGRIGAKAWSAADYPAIKDALEDLRKDLREKPFAAFNPASPDLAESARVGQRFLRVTAEAVYAYRELKRQHAVVDFQDLLVLARDLLRDNADVRARVQERYRHLLIDELQDTDPVQMELVEALCGGGLALGKLFAVGDHSQSIYRFRGANVSLFRDLRRQMPHEGRLELSVNFRSQPQVLHFANALLGPRLIDYETLQPHRSQLSAGPCVEFLWAPRADKENVQEARRREAEWIAARIAAMIGTEALVSDGSGNLRPVRAGDVVLLFRAMSNVHLYEAALRRHGLDYYLVGGRAFFAQQEIYDLLNLLRALENPQDGVSLAGTLRSPFCCLSDEALFVLGRHPDKLWAGLHDPDTCGRLPADQQPRVERARRHLDRWRSLKDRVPIARLLGEVFDDSGYDAATQLEFLGDRKLANLWKLTDLARTFDRSGLFGLAEFIRRLSDLVATQPREEQAATQPENADVVRLMSIHQAKGLEFPVVFVPDLAATGRGSPQPTAHWDATLGCVVRPPSEDDPPPFPRAAWELWEMAEDIEDWHEDLRTLYVACTRAEDYLVLSAALPGEFNPTSAWMLTLSERFDLRTGSCLGRDIPPERIPKVRVVTHPGTGAAGRTEYSVPRTPVRELADLGGVRSIAVEPRNRTMFTVAEVEALLHDQTPEAWQFDSEDGSERNDWLPRSEPIVGCLGKSAVVDRILGRWDFSSADGWRPLLDQETSGRTAEAEQVLARFAKSEAREQLGQAAEMYRNVEYLFPWPPDAAVSGAFAIRGVVDFLWRDTRDRWHLLALGAAVSGESESAVGPVPPLSLILAAWAVQRVYHTWPASAAGYDLETGHLVRFTGHQLRRRPTDLDGLLTAAGGRNRPS